MSRFRFCSCVAAALLLCSVMESLFQNLRMIFCTVVWRFSSSEVNFRVASASSWSLLTPTALPFF